MVEQGKGTRMGHAVNSMIQYINRPSSGRRPDVPLHIVAITDGNSFDDITEPGSRSGFKNEKVVSILIEKKRRTFAYMTRACSTCSISWLAKKFYNLHLKD